MARELLISPRMSVTVYSYLIYLALSIGLTVLGLDLGPGGR
jgi:hypothetical protein